MTIPRYIHHRKIPPSDPDLLASGQCDAAARASGKSGFGIPDTRNAVAQVIRRNHVVVVDRVHLRDAVRLLQLTNADPSGPVEIVADDRGLTLAWGNAVARMPATDWLIGRFEAEPEVFFACLTFRGRVRSRPVSVWLSGRDQIVFGRVRIPGIRFVD
jgi:hypothetical protein